MIRPVNAAVLSSQWAPHVVAPPHDTFTPTTREQYLAQNPDSFMHVTDAPEHNVGHPSEHGIVAARSAAALSRLIDIGAYGAETGPHLFAQRIEVRGYTQNSLLGAVRTDEGALLPHEGTHSARVHGLAAHFAEVGLMSNPVVATCRSTAAASAAIAAARERGHDAAVLDAETADGARITLWSVDPDTAADLAGGSPLYIVDGHHRVAAAALAGFEQVLVSIVPTDELTLGSFDRVVSEITVMGRRILDALADHCDVEEMPDHTAATPSAPGSFGFGVGGGWYLARRRDPAAAGSPPTLDADFLHAEVLPALFDITETSDSRLRYRPSVSASGVGDDDAGDDAVTILVAPVPLEAIFDVADRGRTMPPKTTYLVPKARSGLLLVPCQAETG